MSTVDPNWLAAYLYYPGAPAPFLTSTVAPFVEEVKREGIAEDWFFISYWEKGPHIRLRFRLPDPERREALRVRLADYFKAAFSELSEAVPSVSDPEIRVPGTVFFAEYEPETTRYGGTQAMPVAERLFQVSSESVLSVLQKQHAQWSYERAMGAAIQMHLALAHSCCKNHKEACLFFEYVFKSWAPAAYHPAYTGLSEATFLEKREEALQAFEVNFEAQRETLVPFQEQVWEMLEAGESFDEPWYDNWVKALLEVSAQLTALHQKGLLRVSEEFLAPEGEIPVSQRSVWSVYASYLHMSNNRLGILNRDEGYLAYLMSRSLLVFS